jgi:hypothetical protein
MSKFKSPWNFFPIHEISIPPFKVTFDVGFDQGDLMIFSAQFYDEHGTMSMFGGHSENWRETLLEYLEMIDFAKWQAVIEPESGEPRYMRLSREREESNQRWQNRPLPHLREG